jgi:hypothetical protein
MRGNDDPRVSRLRTPLCAGALGLLAIGQAASGAIIDIIASTNAFVLRTPASANTDQNEAQTIQTKRLNDSNTRLGYLRFDLPAGLNENDITSATLRLTYVSTSAPGTVTTDTVRVHGLLDGAFNAADPTVTEGSWLDTITWNSQPARGTTPNDIPNSGTALPNANTTATALGTSATYPIHPVAPPAQPSLVVDVPLTLADFQAFIAADTNDEITLLFHNLNNVIVSWASLTNTGGHMVPTLRLDVVPEPASLATFALGAAGVLLSRRRQQTIA